jgi:hypothetical protein
MWSNVRSSQLLSVSALSEIHQLFVTEVDTSKSGYLG